MERETEREKEREGEREKERWREKERERDVLGKISVESTGTLGGEEKGKER